LVEFSMMDPRCLSCSGRRKVGDLEIIASAQQGVASAMDNAVIVESDGLTNCFHSRRRNWSLANEQHKRCSNL